MKYSGEPKTFDFDSVGVGHVESFDHVITVADVEAFAQLTKDFNPLHLDKDYARSVGFGKPVVYGMLSASFISRMIGMLIPGKGALWMRQTLEFLLPSYVDDTLTVKAKITQKSLSTRMLVLDIQMTNQNSQVVLKGESHVKVLENMDKKKVMEPERKVILITGASRGIGAATALKLAGERHFIGVNYKSSEKEASDVARRIHEVGGQALLLRGDVSQTQDVSAMVRSLLEKAGRIDGFIHCAAPHPVPVPFENSTWESFQSQMDTQLKGAYLVARELVPEFLKQGSGSMIFISSVYADGQPPAQLAGYVCAKSALNGLARSLAVELGPKGVRVNIISPGLTMTDMTSQVPEKTKMLAKMNTPLRRLGVPEDVAESVAFLMGVGARHISGQNLRVCGGSVML